MEMSSYRSRPEVACVAKECMRKGQRVLLNPRVVPEEYFRVMTENKIKLMIANMFVAITIVS